MLPAHVRAALDARLEGVSRSDLAQRAASISERYRAGGKSKAVIRDPLDALAYAVVRMPATYAAVAEALRRTATHLPGLAPTSLLDLGAGPGTATFAAVETWSSIAAVTEVESNSAFRALAGELRSFGLAHVAVDPRSGDVATVAMEARSAALVVASYLLVELPESQADRFVLRAFESCSDALVLVEPGTSLGFARLRVARTVLIDAGARIVAPCPGEMTCPMSGTDWCHFSVRLARSRDHKLVKGADAPFEDERFCYLVATRSPDVQRPTARVLAEPTVDRGDIALKLCTPDGLAVTRIARRDKAGFKQARKLGWGDEFPNDRDANR